MKVFTMGFTKKNAEQFFSRLHQPGLKRLVDARLNNVSQLAGFTKKDDLKFFLKTVNSMEYITFQSWHLIKSCWKSTRNTTATGMFMNAAFWR